MSWRTPDDDWQTAAALRETRELHGTADPDRTDGDVLHDDALDASDRLAEKAPAEHMALAYRDRPSERERREWFDERRVRNDLRPRSGQVEVQPRAALSATAGAPPACHADAVEGFLPEPTSPPGVGRRTERSTPTVCTCGAAERGMPKRGPAHRYHCPLYSAHREAA